MITKNTVLLIGTLFMTGIAANYMASKGMGTSGQTASAQETGRLTDYSKGYGSHEYSRGYNQPGERQYGYGNTNERGSMNRGTNPDRWSQHTEPTSSMMGTEQEQHYNRTNPVSSTEKWGQRYGQTGPTSSEMMAK